MNANGVEIWLNAKAEGAGPRDCHISKVDWELIRHGVLTPADSTNSTLRVTVDAGHGGEDSGALSEDHLCEEKNLTLSMALMLGKVLRERGFEVNFTRTNDVYLSKSERVKIAKAFKSDLFVSVHCNKASNIEAVGAESYVLPARGFPGTAEGSSSHAWQPGNRSDVENMMAAYEIQKAIITNGTFRADRGIRRQAFHVLRAAQCPAVLVEVGFMSHARELRKLNNPQWQEQQMVSLADGVCSYARRLCAYRRINAEYLAKLEAAEKEKRLAAKRAREKAIEDERRRLQEKQQRQVAVAELERLEREERQLQQAAEKTRSRASQLERMLAEKTDTSRRIAKQLADAEKKEDAETSNDLSEEAAFLLDFYDIRPQRAMPALR